MKIHYTCSFIFFYLSPVLTPLPPPPNTVLRILELSLSQFCKIGSRVRDEVSPGSKAKHSSGVAVSGLLLSGLLAGAIQSEWYLLQQHAFTSDHLDSTSLSRELRAFKKRSLAFP